MEYTIEEVEKHTTVESLWVVIEDKVYDVTNFLEKHPGGQKPIIKYSGKDSTKRFKMVKKHMEIENIMGLLEPMCIGRVNLDIQQE